MLVVPEPPSEVGVSIPANTPHAVSVMFPTWQDNIYYEEGDPRVTSKMECGYPRFFIHPFIQKLCRRMLDKFGNSNENGMLFPSRKVAEQCREFMYRFYPEAQQQPSLLRIVEHEIAPEDPKSGLKRVTVYAVFFPKDAFSAAKQFWQHSGDILSSRMAEYCLRILDANSSASHSASTSKGLDTPSPKGGAHRYMRKPVVTKPLPEDEPCEPEQTTYVEERYGRNLPMVFADKAKVALRRRIAGIIAEHENNDLSITNVVKATQSELDAQRQLKGDRGVKGLTEEDVYLHPCGMSAIFHAHQLALQVGDASRKSVCFGFPYTDTLKILQKFGPGCHFFGIGEDKDIDSLEAILNSGERILALFCELPSNPLLKSPNLARLRKLADQNDFIIVIDETIGNFCNVLALQFGDIVVSSLTKVFSGDSNVMGGSLVLNPNGKHYQAFKDALATSYEDIVWAEDALFLERNSRDFKKRSAIINENAEALCDFLISQDKVEKVFYPKFTCREYYDAVKNPNGGGYGGLFSMVLKSEKAAQTFYDNLFCAKGPSLGTNFTLASPYTILAHYNELDWAEEYGVCRYLIRVSVGLEPKEKLIALFQTALDAIE